MLWLILAFFNAAGLILLIGAEFIAMLLVIVYVGAVAVLFLFVVMMLDIDFAALRSGFPATCRSGSSVALVLLAEIVFAVSAWNAGPARSAAQRRAASDQPNIVALGQLLYTRYLFIFELAGLVLLVAMVGAIVLTHRNRGDARGRTSRTRSAAARRTRSRNISRASGRGSSCDRPRAIISTVGAILFVLGVFGIFLNRKNVIVILMAIELILLASTSTWSPSPPISATWSARCSRCSC